MSRDCIVCLKFVAVSTDLNQSGICRPCQERLEEIGVKKCEPAYIIIQASPANTAHSFTE